MERYADLGARSDMAIRGMYVGVAALVVFAIPLAILGSLLGVVPAGLVTVYAVWRGVTISVVATGDELVVRNMLGTRRIRWADVRGFEQRLVALGSRGWAAYCPVAVTRRGEQVTLLAMPLQKGRRRSLHPRQLRWSRPTKTRYDEAIARWTQEHRLTPWPPAVP